MQPRPIKECMSNEFIRKYLKNDEIILWDQVKSVNLTSKRITISLLIILLSILFGFLYLINSLIGGNLSLLFSLIMTILFLCIIAYVIFHSMKLTKMRSQRLHLTYNELKHVIHFDAITNQRYIRRNFFSDVELYYANYHIKGFETKDQLLFISFDSIEKVSIMDFFHQVVFVLRHEIEQNEYKVLPLRDDFEFLNIAFSPNDSKEWNQLINLIREIIPVNMIN